MQDATNGDGKRHKVVHAGFNITVLGNGHARIGLAVYATLRDAKLGAEELRRRGVRPV